MNDHFFDVHCRDDCIDDCNMSCNDCDCTRSEEGNSGETIRVPLLELPFTFDNNDYDCSETSLESCSSEISDREAREEVQIEVDETNRGQWKYGICSCFQQGVCHRDLWNAWLCPSVLLAQILKRTDLVWLAKPENFHGQKVQDHRMSCVLRWTFRVLFCLVTAAEVYAVYLLQQLQQNETNDDSDLTMKVFWSQELICFVLTLPMSIWMLTVAVRLRRTIRERYQIPPASISVPSCSKNNSPFKLTLGSSEDLVCALCCSFCMLRQMASQTYDLERADSSSQEALTKEQPLNEANQNDDAKKAVRLWCFPRHTTRKDSQTSTLETPLLERPSSPVQTSNNSHLLRQRIPSSPSSASSSADIC